MVELKELPYEYGKLRGISEQTLKFHHDKHYAGYVKVLSALLEKLKGTAKEGNANYSEYGELKRRETFNESGVILHELYFDNFGGDGSASEELEIVKRIAEDFGSFEAWKEDMKACAVSSLGWAILCYNPRDKKLHNYLCDSHNYGAVWGAVPLLALDLFEHAYYHDQGPDRGAYIANFFENLDWNKIDERFKKEILRE